MLCLMQTRIPLCLFAARTLCLLIASLVSVRILRSFSQKIAFQQGYPQHRLMSGAVCRQVEDFVLFLVKVPEISVNPFLQTAEVLLDSSMTLWHITTPPSFVPSSNWPVIQIVDKDAEWYQTQDWDLGCMQTWPNCPDQLEIIKSGVTGT